MWRLLLNTGQLGNWYVEVLIFTIRGDGLGFLSNLNDMRLFKLNLTFPYADNLGAAGMRRNGKLEENHGENDGNQKEG